VQIGWHGGSTGSVMCWGQPHYHPKENKIMLLPFLYKVSGLDDVSNCFLLYGNIWFGFELVNLLMLSYTPGEKQHINRPLPFFPEHREQFN
jgi:hypothetical protein